MLSASAGVMLKANARLTTSNIDPMIRNPNPDLLWAQNIGPPFSCEDILDCKAAACGSAYLVVTFPHESRESPAFRRLPPLSITHCPAAGLTADPESAWTKISFPSSE
jgi:hypothetical protein